MIYRTSDTINQYRCYMHAPGTPQRFLTKDADTSDSGREQRLIIDSVGVFGAINARARPSAVVNCSFDMGTAMGCLEYLHLGVRCD